MDDPKSNRVKHTKTLRNKFESEKRHLSYADVHPEVVKNLEKEEIVKHMSNLPSYLERGKPIQDRALNFGVMDWGRLEKWQFQRQSNKYSPSSSNSSLLFSTDGSSGNLDKFQDSGNAWKTNDFCGKNVLESKSSDNIKISQKTSSSSSSSKGKMRIEDDLVNKVGNFQDPFYNMCDQDRPKNHKTVVLVNSRTNDEKPDPKHKNPPRNISPLRRLSFSTSFKSAAPTKRAESPPVSRNSTKDINTPVSHRAHSSPLRRLLDPIFPSKATYSCKNAEMPPEDSQIKAKLKLDLSTNKIDESSSSRKQALFQTAIKNGRPLFTFAVDNNRDILAATVRSLTRKNTENSWIYTFFSVHEVKKKPGSWLSQKGKGKGHGFIPNIAAQMKVSNRSVSNYTNREFVLFSVNPNRVDHEISDVEPKDELVAIVVRFFEKEGEDENRDGFSTTVIIPGGHHGAPSKGEPSPLIERWRSGGECDCGGWDMGCRLRTLANPVRSSGRSTLLDVNMSSGQFELFFQGEVLNERPFFSMSPLKDGIFSVEYNSSLSLLHAFSICISVMECRKSSQHTEVRTYVAKQVDEDKEGPITYASLPPLSSVERV